MGMRRFRLLVGVPLLTLIAALALSSPMNWGSGYALLATVGRRARRLA